MLFHYFSGESSSSTASSDAGGGESDSDSSFSPTSDSCESGPVLGSIFRTPSGVATFGACYRYWAV